MDIQGNSFDKCNEFFIKYGNQEKIFWEIFYTNDYPVPYKDLLLYPVQVGLYIWFHIFVECLILSKNTSGDAKAISMSSLDYIFYISIKDKKPYVQFLRELLYIVLRKEEKMLISNGSYIDTIDFLAVGDKWNIRIENTMYDSKDFETIRQIICEQNLIEILDESIHPDWIKAYKDMEEYKRKQNELKLCSFEDQINIVVAKTGYKRENIVTMTIRSFSRLFERINKIEDYEVSMMLSPNMEKKHRDKIEHYLSESKFGKLKERIIASRVGFEEYKKKIK
jgi:hypothetical protein